MYSSNKNFLGQKSKQKKMGRRKKPEIKKEVIIVKKEIEEEIKEEIKEEKTEVAYKEPEVEEETKEEESEEEEENKELQSEFEDSEEQEATQEEGLQQEATQGSLLLKKRKTLGTIFKENKTKLIKRVYDRRDIIRGPRTAWIYFLKENRTKGESYAQLCKDLSPVWKAKTEKEKKPYYDKEALDVARYKREECLLTDRDRKILKKIRKRKRQEKAANFPKRPLSAYQLFLQDHRPKIKEEHPDFTFEQIGKELGKRWSEIKIELKEHYIEISMAQSEQYKREKDIHLTEYQFMYKDSPYTCANAKQTRNTKVPM